MNNVYSEHYLKTQIETATKEQLLIMFYDGALRFINRAVSAIEDNNIEQRSYCINKAMAIISELSATLNHDIGGQIAADLEALYDFMHRELIKANSENSKKPLDAVLTILTDLRDTWKEAIIIQKQRTSAPKSPTPGQHEAHKSITVTF